MRKLLIICILGWIVFYQPIWDYQEWVDEDNRGSCYTQDSDNREERRWFESLGEARKFAKKIKEQHKGINIYILKSFD